MKSPIVYSFRRCPYAIGARLALREAGIVCELREVVLKDKPAEMLAVSPKGTVPVLVLSDGRIIDESIDVIQWALEQSDPRGLLTPTTGTVVEMRLLMDSIESDFKFHLDRYKYANRYEGSDSTEHRQLASQYLYKVEGRLQEHDHLYGERPSMADITLAPFVRQFANTDRPWFDSEPWPRLISWLDSFLSAQRFLDVMEKYDQWHEGDEIKLF